MPHCAWHYRAVLKCNKILIGKCIRLLRKLHQMNSTFFFSLKIPNVDSENGQENKVPFVEFLDVERKILIKWSKSGRVKGGQGQE